MEAAKEGTIWHGIKALAHHHSSVARVSLNYANISGCFQHVNNTKFNLLKKQSSKITRRVGLS